MRTDIIVTLETSPKLTEVQVYQIFEQMGDSDYHDEIAEMMAGSEAGAKTSAMMQLQIYGPIDDREVRLMRETRTFLEHTLEERGIHMSRMDLSIVPEFVKNIEPEFRR